MYHVGMPVAPYRQLSKLAEGAMTQQDDWKTGLDPRIADQVDYIVGAFRDQKIAIGVTPANGGVGYMYAEGQLIVRHEYLARVREALRQPDDHEKVRQVVAGADLLTLVKPPKNELPTVVDALDVLDRQFGEGIATPNHVLTVAPEVGPCPATEPQEVYDRIEPSPSVCPAGGGAGVLIYIADTGLLADAASHPWLAGVTGDPDPLPAAAADGTQPIPAYTGHGTFVAGVARCMAPAADVIVSNAFSIAGSALEADLVEDLDAALDLGVDIFHLSITAPTRNDLPLASFLAWLKLLRQYKGVVCVVAAGNNGSRLPSWPAAFAEVISVGALGSDWRSRANFSNFGGWVDVYAPGRNLVNAYPTGSYTCYVEPYIGHVRRFKGMARWSGTSFSAPVVTGLIAARMSRTGENGQQAAAALLAAARSRAIPGVGAIALPGCGYDDVPGQRAECCAGHQPRPCGCGCG
jgi:subtilisin family serine protease